MEPTPTGKAYLVTGAASGIGHSTALTLLARGHSVALTDVNADALATVHAALPPSHQARSIVCTLDVRSRSAMREAIEQARAQLASGGPLSGVANIAGTAGKDLGFTRIWEVEDEVFEHTMNVNTRGCFNVLAEVLRPGVLAERDEHATKGGASVVQVGSIYSLKAFKKGSAYSASKHAALALANSAALEVAERGIRVNSVLPGPIDTPMHRVNLARWGDIPVPPPPLGRDGQAQEVANVICFLLGDESAYVTGSTYSVDGGEIAL